MRRLCFFLLPASVGGKPQALQSGHARSRGPGTWGTRGTVKRGG